jgi:hypothetical protein
LGDVPYVICIGDASKAIINASKKLRFDINDFELSLKFMTPHPHHYIKIYNDGGTVKCVVK